MMIEREPDSRKVRYYFKFRKGIEYLMYSARALHQAIWLGLLNRENLAELTEWRYRQWSDYSDSTYNLSGLEDWEERALKLYFSSCNSVLIGAAGGGREIVALSRQGIEVGAFECSPFFAEAGNKILIAENIHTHIGIARPDHLPEGLGVYDGFIVGWGGYMHIAGKDRRVAFLKESRPHLAKHSFILLSFFTRAVSGPTFRWTLRIANFIRRFRVGVEPVEMGDLLEKTFNHYFTEDEIRLELAEAGFEMVEYSATPYGHAVGRLI